MSNDVIDITSVIRQRDQDAAAEGSHTTSHIAETFDVREPIVQHGVTHMGIVAAAAAVPDFDYSQWIESEVAERVRSERHAGLLFRARLLSTLRAEPVENGVGHHAEELLKSAFMTAPEPTAMRTQSLFTELLGNPAVAAGLITCVGRLRFELVRDVAGSLVVGGLAQANVEIREAAIGAIEQWGGKHFVPILEKHIEPETWLATYVDKVLRDLTTS